MIIEQKRRPKFVRIVGTPIEVFSNGDHEKLGRHYVALHNVQTSAAYERLGEVVETRYVTQVGNKPQ